MRCTIYNININKIIFCYLFNKFIKNIFHIFGSNFTVNVSKLFKKFIAIYKINIYWCVYFKIHIVFKIHKLYTITRK